MTNHTPGIYGAELSAIADRYYTDDGTRKARSYFAEYERIFDGIRFAQLRLLELGVFSGASLRIWQDYLPNATIVGVDINQKPPSLEGQDRIHYVRASQDDSNALDLAAQIGGGPFDVIIDDASHLGYLTKRSLHYLFPRWLKPGGYYVIEDFGTGFLAAYPDGRAYTEPPWDDASESTAVFSSHQYGMVGLLKQLIDTTMKELMEGTPSVVDIERLIILANVAFLRKAMRADMAPETVMAPHAASQSTAAPREDTQSQQLAEIVNLLRSQDARLREIELTSAWIRTSLRPARAVWRLFRPLRHS